MTTTQQISKPVDTSKRLAGKVALVTGSSRGIGAAIALRLAADGATVAVNYSNSKDAAEKIVSRIQELGSKAAAFQANVSSENETRQLIDQVHSTFGDIDILVNNAGVFEFNPIDQITLEHYDRVFNVNVKGLVATTIAALKHFSDGGRIINISSGVSKATMAGASIYSATKAAVETLTRIWATDLGARQITVNSVAPGTTITEMLDAALDDEAKKLYTSKTALGRLGQPEDIADVVAFVASPDARWITGQTIHTDGGLQL